MPLSAEKEEHQKRANNKEKFYEEIKLITFHVFISEDLFLLVGYLRGQ